jgi:Arc/MetJ-type ribon-helix-helix transcriptional regulator
MDGDWLAALFAGLGLTSKVTQFTLTENEVRPMNSMTIALESSQKAFVETRLKAAGLKSASEYIRFLIQKEQLKDLRAEIDKLLLEAQTSGPGTPMTLQDWKDIEQEGLALLAQEKKKS